MLRTPHRVGTEHRSVRGRLPAAAQVLVLDATETLAALGRAAVHDPTDRDRIAATAAPTTRPMSSTPPAPPAHPKGVVVTHQRRSSRLLGGSVFPVRTSGPGSWRSTSICFDFSVFELWVTLLQGGWWSSPNRSRHSRPAGQRPGTPRQHGTVLTADRLFTPMVSRQAIAKPINLGAVKPLEATWCGPLCAGGIDACDQPLRPDRGRPRTPALSD